MVTLFILAPLFGEVVSGATPVLEFVKPISLTILILLYGCGALIVRELVIRWDKGWPSLLLLALAYGIYEEGVMMQSFFDPTWGDLDALAVYGRAAGVNWVWAEQVTLIHALISIACSIAIVEMLFPSRRHCRWVTTRAGWVLNWVGFIGVYLFWELYDHYEPGIVYRVGAWLAILALAGLARVIPKRFLPAREQSVPRPWRFFIVGFFGFLMHFVITYISSDANLYPYPVTMALLAGWYLLLLWLVMRWSGNGAAWDDRHRMSLVSGALSLFIIVVLLATGPEFPLIYFTHPIFLLLLWLAGRSVRRRVLAAE